MIYRLILIAMICVALTGAVQAADEKPVATSQPTTTPAATPTTAPAEEEYTFKLPTPMPNDTVLATVGDRKITVGDVNEKLVGSIMEIPPTQIQAQRKGILDNLIYQRLINTYFESLKIVPNPEAMAQQKKDLAELAEQVNMSLDEFLKEVDLTKQALREQVIADTVIRNATTDEKVAAYIKAHPDYFNGTQVEASHILIRSNPIASTAEQKADRDRLVKVRDDIKAGKITFEKAAEQYSQDPGSAVKGGALGLFTFGKMMPTFSEAAFVTKPGELSDIVHTPFGFHLIKVTKRVDGQMSMPEEQARELAAKTILGNIQMAIFDQTLGSAPVVITEAGKKLNPMPVLPMNSGNRNGY